MGTNRTLLSPTWTVSSSTKSTTSSVSTPTAVVAYPDGRLHFFSLPTCTRIFQNTPSLPSSSGRPISLSLALPTSTPSLLIGTDTGHVYLNSIQISTLTNSSNPAIVTASVDASLLLVATGSPSQLYILDPTQKLSSPPLAIIPLAGDHPAPPSCLAITKDSKHAIVASQQISLIHLDSKKTVRKLAGHPSPVTCASVFRNDSRLITACQADQYLLVWDLLQADTKNTTGSGKKRRRKMSTVTPMATLLAPGIGVSSIVVDESEGEDDELVVAALLASGTVAVWKGLDDFSSGHSKPRECSFVVKPNSDKENGDIPPVFVVTFVKPGKMSILYGNSLQPLVHVVDVKEVHDQAELSLPLWNANGIVSGSGVHVISGNVKSKEMLVKQLPDVEVSNAVAAPALPSTKRKNAGRTTADENMEEGETMMDVDNKNEGQTNDDEEDEMTLEEKLASIGVDTKSIRAKTNSKVTPSLEATRIESRISIILQAARSKDWDLMETSLIALQDRISIRNTVDNLPAGEATGSIFDMLVERLSSYPKDAPKIVPWIREILIRHASALLAQRRNDALTLLVSVIKERTQSQRALSLLQGRLELIVHQADRVRKAKENRRTDNMQPDARYDEEEASSSSSEEEEDGESQDEEESESEEEEDETRGNSDEAESSEASEDSDEEMTEIQSLKGSGPNGIANGKNTAQMNGTVSSDDDESDSDF